MIAFLRGRPVSFGPQSVVLDVQGVGYEIQVSERYRLSLEAAQQEEVLILTWLAHREDAMEIFGFETRQEKALFLLLNQVKGVGLRSALAMLSALSVADIITAIVNNQPATLCQAPGIGSKTAQRIILELREKLTRLYPDFSMTVEAGPLPPAVQQEVEMTLRALGYTPEEILQAWRLLPAKGEHQDADTVIRWLLTQLGP